MPMTYTLTGHAESRREAALCITVLYGMTHKAKYVMIVVPDDDAITEYVRSISRMLPESCIKSTRRVTGQYTLGLLNNTSIWIVTYKLDEAHLCGVHIDVLIEDNVTFQPAWPRLVVQIPDITPYHWILQEE